MSNPGNEYEIIKGIAADSELENYRNCFEKNGSEREIENLRWLHQLNPAQRNTIYYAMHTGDVAAIYTALPLIFNFGGKTAPALQSIDTITDVAHRGKGLFPKLAAILYEDARKNGYKLVYGFPNENSAPGFFNKLKWKSFGQVPFLIKPMKVSYFLRKIFRIKAADSPAGYHSYAAPDLIELSSSSYLKSIEFFNDDYDSLWSTLSTDIKISVDRSAAYMNWRYVQKPMAKYSRYALYSNDSLEGIVVFTLTNKHNGRIGYLMELLFRPNKPEAGKKLLAFTRRIFKQEKADAVLAWSFPHSFNFKAFRKAGYFEMPIKLRPQNLFFGTLILDELNEETISDKSNWYISYSDSDTT